MKEAFCKVSVTFKNCFLAGRFVYPFSDGKPKGGEQLEQVVSSKRVCAATKPTSADIIRDQDGPVRFDQQD